MHHNHLDSSKPADVWIGFQGTLSRLFRKKLKTDMSWVSVILSRFHFSFPFCLLFLPSIVWCVDPASPGTVRVYAGPPAARDQVEAADISPAIEVPPGAGPSELTAALVYAVLVGQIAGQRGEYRLAFAHFLRAARLVRDSEVVELAAETALVLGDAEAMRQTAEVWFDLAPDSIGAHQLAAYAQFDADDLSDLSAVLEYLRPMIALAVAAGEDGYSRTVRLVSKLKQPERRLRLMEILTAEAPENARAWFARAVVAVGADHQETALAAARQASELDLDWTAPRLFLVRLLLQRGDREQARRVLEAFVEEQPKSRDLRLLYAQLLVDEQEFSRARDMFEQILHNTPKERDVLFALGVLSIQMEDLETARDYFTRLYDTGEHQDESTYYLGQVAELADDAETAVSWYRRVTGEQVLDAQVRIALLYAKQRQVARAREILQRLRDRWPENSPMIYLIEGVALADVGRLHEAMAVYDEALAAFPDDHELLYTRGLFALDLSQLDLMERDMLAIIAANPDHADALNALGYSLADLTERFTEALSYIERALALKPDDPAVLDSMGWVQFRLGHPERALKYLRRALDLMPDGEIAAHLGEVLWTLGRHDEARSTWEAALDRDPEHKYLLRVISRYEFTGSDSESR